MRLKMYILGELIVMLFLIIGVDYLPHVICWIPFVWYNYCYLGKIVKAIDWD